MFHKKLEKKSVSDLVTALRTGSEPAFRELFNRYAGKVFRYVMRFVPAEPVAEELMQDVFMKVWNYRENLDASQSFNNFLFRITKNHILNHLRDMQRDVALNKEYRLSLSSFHNAVEESLIHEEYIALANKAIALLPDKRRSIFIMSRLEGMSYEQIAQALDISKDTVRLQMIKSIKSIREYLRLHVDVPIGIVISGLLYFL
ncbi:RNA polymerase sigma factor [Ohtaekwangia kribbensis]|jgi:RNA polymerase sigma-70 factor (family 1)|uniref:RNA polymerase sigma factor n=1 Tax=Ohtaekwangia kribbensis TaxID=688913 RepID=A0ABW3K4Q5_9BACT